jgi:CheY-like chemotaxis protein
MAIDGVLKPNNTGPEQNEKIDLSILIADDDPSFRELLQRKLGKKYSSIETEKSGELLISRLFAGSKVDFIITDYNMPGGMNGLEVIKKIRADTRFKNIPIIMLTSSMTDSLKQEVEELGALCLSKDDIKDDELYKAIEKLREKQV